MPEVKSSESVYVPALFPKEGRLPSNARSVSANYHLQMAEGDRYRQELNEQQGLPEAHRWFGRAGEGGGLMMPIVRMGDPLRPFGGQVLEGHYMTFGKPVACVGDQVRCTRHGLTRIIQGASGSTLNGKPVALDGHRCGCGCQLVSTLAATSMIVAP